MAALLSGNETKMLRVIKVKVVRLVVEWQQIASWEGKIRECSIQVAQALTNVER